MPTRNERLANHYIAAMGVTGVFIEQGKLIFQAGQCVSVTVAKPPASRRIFCVARPGHALLVVERLSALLPSVTDWDGAMAALKVVAADACIGITPHDVVARRACEVVHEVNARFEAMRATFQLKGLNREFKARRGHGEAVTYADFIHAKKADMLTVMARTL